MTCVLPAMMLLAGVTWSEVPGTPPEPARSRGDLALGVGLLATEYVVGPLAAQAAWWSEGFTWGNPFSNIGEEEPYLEDNAWHVACCAMVTELHHRIFNDYLKTPYPVVLSSALTLVTYTGIECLDALEKTRQWTFSVGDEVANCIGIGFWVFKYYYPNVPLYVRVGVRKWGDTFEMAGAALSIVDGYDEYRRRRPDRYSMLTVETIYKVYDEFYVGAALSKTEKPESKDLWGVTAGYDILRKLAGGGDGWWRGAARTVSEYTSTSLQFTYWVR